jgi:large subunit ribosomal protein L6
LQKWASPLPTGVDVQIKEDQITVKGSGGELKLAPNPLVKSRDQGRQAVVRAGQ